MKVKSILFLFFSLAITSLHAQRIKGSDTVLPVAQQTAERFMNKHADAASPSPEAEPVWVSPH